jgi:pimeloyl-ACP methyl ester carboxylesterase
MAVTMAKREIEVVHENVRLPGTLAIPPEACGAVIFAHGSGSSRLSRRNQAVAAALVDYGCATLLFDLLTPEEATDRRNVFDIGLLGARVGGAARWLLEQEPVRCWPVGLFGASTGAAAALVAAAELEHDVAAVVSRGGRPDLAGDALPRVMAPTLLIVGSLDVPVLELNEQASRCLTCPHRLDIVQGATHLFEEPGTLEQVAQRAGTWFVERFHDRRPGAGD